MNTRPSTKRIHPTLPVFRIDEVDQCVIYTPGNFAIIDADTANGLQRLWAGDPVNKDDELVQDVSCWIEGHAGKAVEARKARLIEPFFPECLTVYLSNYCNLACVYCFAAGKETRVPGKTVGLPVVNEAAIRAAALLVARNCAEKRKPFSLVLHGGGEPTMHWELVRNIVELTKSLAQENGISWFGYIATNGVMPEERVEWLAGQFDIVGLSCDGPPEIQDCQRPLHDGRKSSALVERTASALKRAGGRLEVRSTITPSTMERQSEIVSYLRTTLGASVVRFEPVYCNQNLARARFTRADADVFSKHFLAAQDLAAALGCTLSFSGVRLNELHGPYCDALRNVLHLTPDGGATACFFSVNGIDAVGGQLRIGGFDKARGIYVLDVEKIDAHRRKAGRIPAACAKCINAYHCARSCPDSCCVLAEGWQSRVSNDGETRESAEFRCVVQQDLTRAWVLRSARRIAAEDAHKIMSSRPGINDNALAACLRELPSCVDRDSILAQWHAVKKKYDIENRAMPSPVWKERGFEHDGTQTWEELKRIIPVASPGASVATYIHIPFCETRCGFCDCYSLVPGRGKSALEEKYVDALLREMDSWANLLQSGRPVSTVHFGGGTPNCLSPELFAKIVDHYRKCFFTAPDIEWALESTSRLLTPDHLDRLRALGFSRLHIGVQTLELPLRRRLGRKESAEEVMTRIAAALERGFTTTVDLIYGLPGQTIPGFMNSITRLVAGGIHGISLYRLNHSNRNNAYLTRINGLSRNALRDYVLFQAAEQLLMRSGYRKNHFAHFSLPRDKNLYYTHALREEDLLSLGATADGVFGHYHYRHPEYPRYVNGGNADYPVLEGGLLESPIERKIRTAVAALMCGEISKSILGALNAESLWEQWMDSALIIAGDGGKEFVLTANGSWFVSEMIAQVKKNAFVDTV